MPTPVYLTGFEHGKAVVGAAVTPTNDRIFTTVVATGGTPGIDATTPKHGARCLDIPATSGAAAYCARVIAGTPAIAVAGFFVRFIGSLPTADCTIFTFGPVTGSFNSVVYQSATTSIRAKTGSTVGSTGVTVVADRWYRIDCKADAGATRTMDAQVDGVAVGQASQAQAASTWSSFRIGKNTETTTANGNIRFDDLVVSVTSADYPLGDHECLRMSPNADGTHSFTANDFIRGDAGAAILVTDTDVWTLVDDVPFGAIGTTDSVKQNVIRTTGYVEFNFDAAPSAQTAWGIQTFGQFDADAAGADTSGMRLWDGTTEDTLYGPPNGDVSNIDAEGFLSFARALNPSGGAWDTTALNGIRARWGFSSDVIGAPILHALMIEAAFPVVAGPPPAFSYPQLERVARGAGRGVVTGGR